MWPFYPTTLTTCYVVVDSLLMSCWTLLVRSEHIGQILRAVHLTNLCAADTDHRWTMPLSSRWCCRMFLPAEETQIWTVDRLSHCRRTVVHSHKIKFSSSQNRCVILQVQSLLKKICSQSTSPCQEALCNTVKPLLPLMDHKAVPPLSTKSLSRLRQPTAVTPNQVACRRSWVTWLRQILHCKRNSAREISISHSLPRTFSASMNSFGSLPVTSRQCFVIYSNLWTRPALIELWTIMLVSWNTRTNGV